MGVWCWFLVLFLWYQCCYVPGWLWSSLKFCPGTSLFPHFVTFLWPAGFVFIHSTLFAQMPVQGQNQKMICCLCCASGPIVAEFRLERRGYVPGEPIHLFADIRNNSNRKMDRSYIDLRMVSRSRSWKKVELMTFYDGEGWYSVCRYVHGYLEAVLLLPNWSVSYCIRRISLCSNFSDTAVWQWESFPTITCIYTC